MTKNDDAGPSRELPDIPGIPRELLEGHTVTPLTSCPHLDQVRSLPEGGIDANSVCTSCGVIAEPWMCLTCYQAHCGRFVNEHALLHHLDSSHSMALSLADLSVWCYPCESYVHNEVLIPAKQAAHESKFGEKMPSPSTSST